MIKIEYFYNKYAGLLAILFIFFHKLCHRRKNLIATAMELMQSCTKPLILLIWLLSMEMQEHKSAYKELQCFIVDSDRKYNFFTF